MVDFETTVLQSHFRPGASAFRMLRWWSQWEQVLAYVGMRIRRGPCLTDQAEILAMDVKEQECNVAVTLMHVVATLQPGHTRQRKTVGIQIATQEMPRPGESASTSAKTTLI